MGFIFHLRSSAFICGQFALLHVSAVKMSPALRPCEKSFRRLLKIECLWQTATLLLRLAGVENRAQAQRIKKTATPHPLLLPPCRSSKSHQIFPCNHFAGEYFSSSADDLLRTISGNNMAEDQLFDLRFARQFRRLLRCAVISLQPLGGFSLLYPVEVFRKVHLAYQHVRVLHSGHRVLVRM